MYETAPIEEKKVPKMENSFEPVDSTPPSFVSSDTVALTGTTSLHITSFISASAPMWTPNSCSAECFTRVCVELNAINAAAVSKSSFDFERETVCPDAF